MAKHKARDDEPEPLEAGLKVPGPSLAPEGDDFDVDEYLLLKVVEANGEHLRTMRGSLALGFVLLVMQPLVAFQLGPVAALAMNLVALLFLAIGLHALARQLELLRRAVAATDHFVFGETSDSDE